MSVGGPTGDWKTGKDCGGWLLLPWTLLGKAVGVLTVIITSGWVMIAWWRVERVARETVVRQGDIEWKREDVVRARVPSGGWR